MTVHSARFPAAAPLAASRAATPLPGARYLDQLGREIEVVEIRETPLTGLQRFVVRVPHVSTGRSVLQEWVPAVWDRMIAVGPLVEADGA